MVMTNRNDHVCLSREVCKDESFTQRLIMGVRWAVLVRSRGHYYPRELEPPRLRHGNRHEGVPGIQERIPGIREKARNLK